MISATIYTLALATIGFVFLSYMIAYRLKRSLSVLSMALFFFCVFLVVLASTIQLWAREFDLTYRLPLAEIRGTLLFGSALFLLYTTWRTNKTP